MSIELREERGVAMVVALLVAMVVFMLSTVVIAQSIHSVDASGYDRQRLLSVNIAESGTNVWWAYLQTTAAASISCTAKTATVSSGPSNGQYSATATFYAADLTTTMTCPFSSSSYPAYARIVSTGTISGDTPRTMETLVKLTPVYSGFGSAIMSNAATTFSNNFDVYGQAGNDGDVYVLNGNLSISNSPEIRGNVYVPYGGVTQFNGSTIYGNLLARDSITINNPAVVKGNVAVRPRQHRRDGDDRGQRERRRHDRGHAHGRVARRPRTPTWRRPPPRPFPTIGYTASRLDGRRLQHHRLHDLRQLGRGHELREGLQLDALVVGRERLHEHRAADQQRRRLHVRERQQRHEHDQGRTSRSSPSWGFDLSNGRTGTACPAPIKKMYFISTAPAASCPASGTTNKNIVVGQQHELRRVHERALLHAVHRHDVEPEQLQRAGDGQQRHDQQPLHDDVHAGVGAGRTATITSFQQDIAYVREVPSS